MKQINLSATPRAEHGRTASRSLRKSGRVPAVFYGESGVRSLAINTHELSMAHRAMVGRAALVELKIEGDADTHFAIIQETQRDATTDAFVHVDFKEIVRGRDMEADIPVRVVGTAIGVRNQGGILELLTDELTVRCRPRDLPEFIQVDVTQMAVGDSIYVKDITAPEGVTFLDDADHIVASCVAVKVAEETTAAPAEAAEAAPAAPAKA